MLDPADVQELHVRRRATLARLRRVNAALSHWEEYHAAAALPAEIRPTVEPPTLSWASLKELQQMLADLLGELEEAWETWQAERWN